MKQKQKVRLKRNEELVKIKKLTFKKMFVLLFLLMSIDSITSYVAVKSMNVYEVNVLARFFFGLGVKGFIVWYLICILFLVFWLILYSWAETKIVKKENRKSFRLKFYYIVLGMYAYVFVNNLRTVLSMFFRFS